jgi:CBS domain-containing protein
MKASELMSEDVQCVTPETSLQDAAGMMAGEHVGLLPVVDKQQKVIGVITDRDIVCRTIAQGRNPLELRVSDAMSEGGLWCVSPDTELEKVCSVMEQHQVRRVPVVDAKGKCCGIIAQADIARQGSDSAVADLVQAVSRPR